MLDKQPKVKKSIIPLSIVLFWGGDAAPLRNPPSSIIPAGYLTFIPNPTAAAQERKKWYPIIKKINRVLLFMSSLDMPF